MTYLDLAKKKLLNKGITPSKADENFTKRKINIDFKKDPSYRLVNIYKDNMTKEEKVDIRIINTDSTTKHKKIYFRPDTIYNVGDYVELPNNKTYIIYEFEENLLSPMAKGYYCNNTLNAKGWKAPLPCYLDNSSYEVKGVLDSEYLSSIDGQLLCYIQDNAIAKSIYIDMRFIFDHDEKEIYKVIKTETVVTGVDKLRQIVLKKDETNDSKDDLINNIAYNPKLDSGTVNPQPTPTATYNIVSDNGDLAIKKYATRIFKIVDGNGVDSPDVWKITVDQTGLTNGFITINGMTSNSVTITNNGGLFKNGIKISFLKGSDLVETNVKLVVNKV